MIEEKISQGRTFFCVPTDCKLTLGHVQSPLQRLPELNWPVPEADHLPARISEYKNVWISAFIRHTSSWRGTQAH